jgi:hypothetical protein
VRSSAASTVRRLPAGVHRQLEHRIMPQRISIIAVFIARGDHQHTEADDLVELVGDLFRHTRVGDGALSAISVQSTRLRSASQAEIARRSTVGHHRGINHRLGK